MLRLNRKGITEATLYYIIAAVLGIILVVIYILFIGPGTIINGLSNFFGGFVSGIMHGFGG